MRTALLLGFCASLFVAGGCSAPPQDSGSATGNIEDDCTPVLNGTIYQTEYQAQAAWPSRGIAVEASLRGMSYPATSDLTNGMYVIKPGPNMSGQGTFSVFVEQPTGPATLSTHLYAGCGTNIMDVYLGQDETGAWSITTTQSPL